MMFAAREISPEASFTVLPSSRVRRRARSSCSDRRRAAAFRRIPPRTGAGVSFQPRKARWAARTACRASSAVESGISPRMSRVSAGFTFLRVRGEAEATHSPPMKFR